MQGARSALPRGRSRAEDERAFRAAVRHSRLVRFLRLAIPVSIVVMLGVIAGATIFKPMSAFPKLPFDPGKLGIAGTKITMQAPRLAGYTRDARPYEVTAATAAQDVTKPNVIELQGISARVEMQDKSVMQMQAQSGVFDTSTEMLWLGHEITMSMSGYEGRMTDAVVDIKKGRVVSDTPVELKMLNGDLKGRRMEITNSGEVIRFEDGVELNLMLNSPQQKAPER